MRILLPRALVQQPDATTVRRARGRGHDVSVELDVNDRVTEEAVALWRPDLIVAPFLKRRIPEAIWRRHRCIVIHPGIRGDRGPSALDWAIMNGEREWGVTALQANGEMDAGDVWAEVDFPMREATKSSLYRHEVTEAAVAALGLALDRLAPGVAPEPLDYGDPSVRGALRPPMRQPDRAIDWQRTTRRRSCARSVRRTARQACWTSLRHRVLSLRRASRGPARFGATLATSSRSATARSCARRSTARCGSRISRRRRRAARSSCRRRRSWATGSPACPEIVARAGGGRSTTRRGGRSATKSAAVVG